MARYREGACGWQIKKIIYIYIHFKFQGTSWTPLKKGMENYLPCFVFKRLQELLLLKHIFILLAWEMRMPKLISRKVRMSSDNVMRISKGLV